MTYKLDLSEHMEIYLVFHAWLLHSHDANSMDGQEVLPCESAEIHEDGATEYPADEVMNSRVIKQVDPRTKTKPLLQYKILFHNSPV